MFGNKFRFSIHGMIKKINMRYLSLMPFGVAFRGIKIVLVYIEITHSSHMDFILQEDFSDSSQEETNVSNTMLSLTAFSLYHLSSHKIKITCDIKNKRILALWSKVK